MAGVDYLIIHNTWSSALHIWNFTRMLQLVVTIYISSYHGITISFDLGFHR
nr:MAG TPA: hypothetical protein [Caudoviricetes sp.]